MRDTENQEREMTGKSSNKRHLSPAPPASHTEAPAGVDEAESFVKSLISEGSRKASAWPLLCTGVHSGEVLGTLVGLKNHFKLTRLIFSWAIFDLLNLTSEIYICRTSTHFN